MTRVVIDTNIFVAVLDGRDVHHNAAMKIIRDIENEDCDIVIMDCVVNEVYSVIAKRSRQRGYSFPEAAVRIKKAMSSFNIMRVYPLVRSLHDGIVDLMRQFDGRLNYHDALICLAMREKNISDIATLDKGFRDVSWIKIR